MSLFVSEESNGKSYQPAPEGVHRFVCTQIIDLGMHLNEYNGKYQRLVRINFELVDELMEDGRPFIVGRDYNLSLNEKANLRKTLDSWRGRAFTAEELKQFDLSKILGACGQINITHQVGASSGNKYAKIEGIMPLSKGMEKPVTESDLLEFNTDEPNFEVFNKLHEYLQKRIDEGVSNKQNNASAPVDKTPEPQEKFDEELSF